MEIKLMLIRWAVVLIVTGMIWFIVSAVLFIVFHFFLGEAEHDLNFRRSYRWTRGLCTLLLASVAAGAICLSCH